MSNEYSRSIPDVKTVVNSHVKTVADVASDLKVELQEFVATRIAILRSEMGTKLRTIRVAMPSLVVGLMLLATAWLAFTAFLVCIIAQGFGPTSWAFVAAFIIVAALYALVGGIVAMVAWKKMSETGVKPERTVRVLEEDRIWLQTEARTQL